MRVGLWTLRPLCMLDRQDLAKHPRASPSARRRLALGIEFQSHDDTCNLKTLCDLSVFQSFLFFAAFKASFSARAASSRA
jgi:hypothetical protein